MRRARIAVRGGSRRPARSGFRRGSASSAPPIASSRSRPARSACDLTSIIRRSDMPGHLARRRPKRPSTSRILPASIRFLNVPLSFVELRVTCIRDELDIGTLHDRLFGRCTKTLSMTPRMLAGGRTVDVPELRLFSARRRHSSAVEQLFRKQQVLGSNPSVGSSIFRTRARLAGRLFVHARPLPSAARDSPCSSGRAEDSWPTSRPVVMSGDAVAECTRSGRCRTFGLAGTSRLPWHARSSALLAGPPAAVALSAVRDAGGNAVRRRLRRRTNAAGRPLAGWPRARPRRPRGRNAIATLPTVSPATSRRRCGSVWVANGPAASVIPDRPIDARNDRHHPGSGSGVRGGAGRSGVMWLTSNPETA